MSLAHAERQADSGTVLEDGCGSVVAAAFKPFRHTGNAFQTKLAVVLGVEGVEGLDKGREMVVEDTSQYICPPRGIGGGLCGRDRGGR